VSLIGPWEILLIINIVVIQLIYYLPSLVTIVRKRPDILKIFLFNMLLGWTIIGWILALMWSLKNHKEP